MSVELPVEIIEKIFKKLPLEDLKTCKQVCWLWQELAGEIMEEYWKNRCKKDFPEECEEAERKTCMFWEGLHESLSLWPRVAEADVKCYETNDDVVITPRRGMRSFRPQFFTLKEEIVAIAEYWADNDMQQMRAGVFGYFNTIAYYNVENMQLSHKWDLDCEFDRHFENDDFLIIGKREGGGKRRTLVVKNKNDGFLEENLGEIFSWDTFDDGEDADEFFVVKNNIFYFNKQKVLHVARYVEEAEDVYKLEVEAFMKPDFQNLAFENGFTGWVDIHIVAMGYISPNQVNMLHHRGLVYGLDLKEKKLSYVCQISKNINNGNEVVKKLKECGFEWSRPDVFNHFIKTHDIIEGDWVAITRVKDPIVFRQGKVVLVATTRCRRSVHVYYNPYNKYGELKLYNAKPLFKLDLNEVIPIDPRDYYYRNIKQLDIVEKYSGHRIIVMYSNRLTVIQFNHYIPKLATPQHLRTEKYSWRSRWAEYIYE